MGVGQSLGQKAGVNWAIHSGERYSDSETETETERSRIPTSNQGHRQNGRKTSPPESGVCGCLLLSTQNQNSLERQSTGAHLGQWAAIIGARCVGCLTWKELGWMHISVCVCMGVCVFFFVPDAPHRTSSTKWKAPPGSKENPLVSNALTCACPSVQSMGFCLLFHAKLLTRLTENLLSFRYCPAVAFFIAGFMPRVLLFLFGLTQIFGSCHIAPICSTNKRTTRLEAK